MSLMIRLALLVSLALPALVVAQNPFRLKTGATGKVCLDCHVTVQEQMSLPHVHTPVKSGDCSDCHNPHAGSHGKLLAAEPEEICGTCHTDIVPENPISQHQAVLEGNCTVCHDPHASEHPKSLTATGNQLCFDCHEDLALKVFNSEFDHAPVKTGCTNCHNPHASSNAEFLLSQPTGTLCSGCHRTNQASFIERHMGYPVAKSRCTSCHDPHGSDRSGILLAEVHEPISNKMCNQCHNDASAENALETKKQGIQLCRGCHSSMVNQTLGRERLHWPVGDRKACLNCHNPHASNEQALLLQPTADLCSECHPGPVAAQEASLTKHQPISEGQCSTCHAAHSADHAFLLEAATVNDVCGNCHDWKTHSTHPLGEDVTDQRNMNLSIDCTSCHTAHGSPFKGFAHADPDGDLCVGCHQQIAR